jgi:hypothetical protein
MASLKEKKSKNDKNDHCDADMELLQENKDDEQCPATKNLDKIVKFKVKKPSRHDPSNNTLRRHTRSSNALKEMNQIETKCSNISTDNNQVNIVKRVT